MWEDFDLLCNHDHEAGKRCTSNSRNCEELSESSQVVAFANDTRFDLELTMDVIQVSCGLQWVEAEFQQRSVGLVIFVFLHVPSRRSFEC